jgi:hypothetical protein
MVLFCKFKFQPIRRKMLFDWVNQIVNSILVSFLSGLNFKRKINYLIIGNQQIKILTVKTFWRRFESRDGKFIFDFFI